MDYSRFSPDRGLYTLDLERRDDGRIEERRETLAGRETRLFYGYDGAGRLITAALDRGRGCEAYEYDPQGRRKLDKNMRRGLGPRRFRYDWRNRLLAVDQVRFEHDDNEFRSARIEPGGRVTRYHYAPTWELLAVELPDDRVIEYGHDRYGRRISKSINGRLVETYAWQGLVQLTGYEDGTGAMAFHYGSGRPPLALTRNGQRFSLHFDQVGTLRAVAHESGRLIQTSAYDSFGNPLEVPHPEVRIPLGFAGGLLDSDTGLTRFGFRDYDPDTGRFTAKDPLGHLGGDPDLYGYCLDDPVNRVDPAGLDSVYFGGDGRPFWQPRYGNWGGEDWSGGQNPRTHGGRDGDAPAVDSSDETYQRHDRCYSQVEAGGNMTKSDCDRELVRELRGLSKDPKDWSRPAQKGTEMDANDFREGAIWWFGGNGLGTVDDKK